MEPSEKITEKLLLERLRLDQELERHRHLMAVMFVDIAGSTRFYEERGDVAGVVMVQRMERLLLPLIRQHGGVVVKTIGDAVMSRFESAAAAVHCAVEIQRRIAQQNESLPDTDHLLMRAAINFGFGFLRNNDVFGDFVNVASRIEGVAEPGEILISPSVFEQIQHLDDLPVRPKASGVELKGKAAPLDLYQVLWRENAPRLPHPTAPSREQLTMATGMMISMTPKPETSFVLVRLYTDGSLAERYPIDRSALIVGYGPVDIRLPQEPSLAQQHARFLLHDGLQVEELASDRAVFVRLRESHKLTHGDVLIAGNSCFQFETTQVPVSADPAGPLGPRTPGGAPRGGRIKLGTRGSFDPVKLERQVSGSPGTRPFASGPGLAPSASLIHVDEAHREIGRYSLAGETTIGRTQGTYTFADDFMSGKHCHITLADGVFTLEDLGSTNGTFARIRGRRLLSEGDVVRLGSCLLKVLVECA